MFFEDIEDDQIESGFYGLRSNDGGVDFVFEDEDKNILYLCQLKTTNSYKCDGNLKEGDLDHLRGYIEKTKQDSWLKTKAKAVGEIAEQVRNIETSRGVIKKIFFHMGAAQDTHYDTAKRYEIDLYSWNEIFKKHEELMQKTSEDEYIKDNTINILKAADGSVFQQIKSTNKGYSRIGVVSAESLRTLFKKYGYKLFDQNIRYSLGSNSINMGMEATINSEPNNFYYFNNGITITCDTSTTTNEDTEIHIKNPSVINGAQTVSTLSNYKNKNTNNDISKIKILCRVIVRDSASLTGRTFISNLTKYNNTHNPVKEVDFLSKRPEQIALNEKFEENGIFYEHKRGVWNSYKKEKKAKLGSSYKLNIKKLMQILAAISYKPNKSKNIGEVLKISIGDSKPSNIYFEFIFGKHQENWDKIGKEALSKSRFNEILLAVRLFGEIEDIIKTIEKCLKLKNTKTAGEVDDEILKISRENGFFKEYDAGDLENFLSTYYYIVDAKFIVLSIFWKIIELKKDASNTFDVTNLDADKIKLLVQKWFEHILDYFEKPCENAIEKNINLKTYFKNESSWSDVLKQIDKKKLKDVNMKNFDL